MKTAWLITLTIFLTITVVAWAWSYWQPWSVNMFSATTTRALTFEGGGIAFWSDARAKPPSDTRLERMNDGVSSGVMGFLWKTSTDFWSIHIPFWFLSLIFGFYPSRWLYQRARYGNADAEPTEETTE